MSPDDERAIAEVELANATFYAAHEARDLDAMSAVWEHSPRAVCIHPGWPILRTLEYSIVRDGALVRRETLLAGGECGGPIDPIYGRFHATAEGVLLAVYSASAPDSAGQSSRVLFLMPVYPRLDREAAIKVNLEKPFGTFFTASERGGSSSSNILCWRR